MKTLKMYQSTPRSIQKVFTLISLIVLSNGFPITDTTLEAKPDRLREEKVLPNGTVIGQYRYTDKDGNPVQVKYYADGTSYGVELNSMKLIQDQVPEAPPTTLTAITSKETTPEEPTPLDTMKYPPYTKKYKTHDPILDFLNKETKSKYRSQKHSSDYETYMLNSVEDSKKCKDKVRVYTREPENRIVRNILNDDYTDKVCNQLL